MEEVLALKRCAACAEMALYRGPSLLLGGFAFCSETCMILWDVVTPGLWVEACELMPGGRYYNRPDIWTDA